MIHKGYTGCCEWGCDFRDINCEMAYPSIKHISRENVESVFAQRGLDLYTTTDVGILSGV